MGSLGKVSLLSGTEPADHLAEDQKRFNQLPEMPQNPQETSLLDNRFSEIVSFLSDTS